MSYLYFTYTKLCQNSWNIFFLLLYSLREMDKHQQKLSTGIMILLSVFQQNFF